MGAKFSQKLWLISLKLHHLNIHNSATELCPKHPLSVYRLLFHTGGCQAVNNISTTHILLTEY